MRTWIYGTVLAGLTAGGLAFVFAGVNTSSHCGPCLASPAVVSPEPEPASEGPVGEPVTEVVDLAAALTAPPSRPKGPFVSFDEPPLARRTDDPRSPRPMPGPGIVQADFVIPIEYDLEAAPMPRRIRTADELPLFSPADPF